MVAKRRRRQEESSLGCLTIASKNYLAAARVLLGSFKRHHPSARTFLLLVDEVEGYFDPADEDFELLTLADINLPWPEVFPYQYSILELNTAVKPFALEFLFKRHGLQQLIYLDPDILVFRRFDSVLKDLADGKSIVLTPHLFEPYHDHRNPTELTILQSGTYNLGFIALRNSDPALRMLTWWKEKNELDCVVDIPNGMFVDQKWMDLVPGYCEGVSICRDPSLNVAYWNLHERELSLENRCFRVNDVPLTFFHFSGYSPDYPDILSKHQDRHFPAQNPILKDLCRVYGEALDSAGREQTDDYPYFFGRLPNDIPVTPHIQALLRQALRRGIRFPSPTRETDAFCRFLCTTHCGFGHGALPPIVVALIARRMDVEEVFLRRDEGIDRAGVVNWLKGNGGKEENLDRLIKKYGELLSAPSPVDKAADLWRNRGDLNELFTDIFASEHSLSGFIAWMAVHGIQEGVFVEDEVSRMAAARRSIGKIVNVLFGRPDVRALCTSSFTRDDASRLVAWLEGAGAAEEGITFDEVRFFAHWLEANYENFRNNFLAYSNAAAHPKSPSMFLAAAAAGENVDEEAAETISNAGLDPLAALECSYASDVRNIAFYPNAFSHSDPFKAFCGSAAVAAALNKLRAPALLKRLRHRMREFQVKPQGINLVGYHGAPTGMGESCRSMARSLCLAEYEVNQVSLPIKCDDRGSRFLGGDGLYFGWPNAAFRTNIVVANADSMTAVRDFLPRSFWLDRKTIGYWVWETDTFPQKQRDTSGLHEIWTPSEFSRRAIAAAVDIPVFTVPHLLDFELLKNVVPNRARFGLPEKILLVGCFFDVDSVIERKNPVAVIEAFREAYGTNGNAALVLKVNGATIHSKELARVRAAAVGLPTIWFIQPMPRLDVLTLLKSLDVYVSLHRSEGFGLVPAEAIAMGVTTVASGYSGNLEFMDDSSNLLVETPSVELQHDFGPYLKGSVWGNPSIEHAASILHRVRDDSFRLESATRARAKLHRDIGADKIAAVVSHRLEKLGLTKTWGETEWKPRARKPHTVAT